MPKRTRKESEQRMIMEGVDQEKINLHTTAFNIAHKNNEQNFSTELRDAATQYLLDLFGRSSKGKLN